MREEIRKESGNLIRKIINLCKFVPFTTNKVKIKYECRRKKLLHNNFYRNTKEFTREWQLTFQLPILRTVSR